MKLATYGHSWPRVQYNKIQLHHQVSVTTEDNAQYSRYYRMVHWCNVDVHITQKEAQNRDQGLTAVRMAVDTNGH